MNKAQARSHIAITRIYAVFDEMDMPVDEAVSILILATMDISKEYDIPTKNIIKAMEDREKILDALQNPHSTVQ